MGKNNCALEHGAFSVVCCCSCTGQEKMKRGTFVIYQIYVVLPALSMELWWKLIYNCRTNVRFVSVKHEEVGSGFRQWEWISFFGMRSMVP